MVGEGLAQDTSFPAMHDLVNDIVCVVHAFDGREGVVEVGLLEPLAMSVDIMEALSSVHRDEVRCHANVRAVLFVKSAEPQVPVSLKAMVELDPGGDGSEQGTWDAAERVEEAIVGCVDK